MRREGPAALTTGRLTKAAGIVQSGFYKHFRDVAECQEAAAEQVAERIRYFNAAGAFRMRSTSPYDVHALAAHLEVMLEAVLTEREFAELFFRTRYDDSPLGQVMRRFIEGVREDIVTHLWELGRQYRLQDHHRRTLEHQADFCLQVALGAVEAALHDRIKKPEIPAVSRQLAYNILTPLQSLYRELERAG